MRLRKRQDSPGPDLRAERKARRPQRTLTRPESCHYSCLLHLSYEERNSIMLNVIHSLREGLAKTRKNISDRIGSLILGEKIDESFLDELEEALIASDVGTQTTAMVLDDLKERFKRNELSSPEQVRERLKQVLFEIVSRGPVSLSLTGTLSVILIVGVNGTGKTTTIGKLAHRLQKEGKKVMLAAADTFRAAAAEQLVVWGDRNNIPVIKHKEGADPGAVVFDALAAAKARGMEVLIVDTAGRLHTKSNLMEELKKVQRILARELPGAPQETLFVLDATTGQNALAQARTFHQAIGITGIVLTKLDGTPKGGIVFAINKELGLPVKFVGIGEGIEDLKDFDPREFVEALL
ncbi:MAG: signal recognition particle-docking protein FtsY [Nitrospirae bacterium]|nr:signal recognition particle-docking protein FtsY [Nitrospirota bacterium]NTW65404.1 signal recognition particle-docking protein FtsY [Nitrospirota bacterium]